MTRINPARGDTMRDVNARLFVTLDSVIESPENWVKPDADMFAAMEADQLALVR